MLTKWCQLFLSVSFNDFFQIDLADIKAEYEKMKGIPLKQVIEDRLKGDLEKLLLQILGDWETIFFSNQFNHREALRHEIWTFLFKRRI